MAALLTAMGVRAEAVIGHSVGELAASVTAGVMTLEEGACYTARRGRLMGAMAPGAMLGVKAPRDAVEPQLKDGAVIAGVNSAAVTVVSGTFDAIAATEEALQEAGLEATRLAVSHGFHSPTMRDAALELGAPGVGADPGAGLAVYSTFTGSRMEASRWGEGAYWHDQMLGPVLFADAVGAAMADGMNCFIEVGPGGVLSALTLQSAEADISVIPTLGPAKLPGDARETMLTALGAYWSQGGELDWEALQPGPFRRVSLPTYPFERKRFWVEPSESRSITESDQGDLPGLIRQQLGVVEAQLAALRRK